MPAQLYIDIAVNAALYSLLLTGYHFHSVLKQTSNFAFGALVAVAGYMYWLGRESELGVIYSILLALLITGVVAVVIEGVFAFFTKQREMKLELLLVVGLAILIIAESILQILYGSGARVITVFTPTTYQFWGMRVTEQQAYLTLGATIIGVLLVWWMHYTRSGLRFRAVEERREVAASVAISPISAQRLALGITLVTAVAAGIYVASERTLTPHIGTGYVILAFILDIVAGGNSRWWIPICLAFAAFETLATWTIGSTLADVIFYLFIFVFLLRTGRKIKHA